ncbi:MAG: hypothetical protein V1839_03750 [archaeon]
MNKRGYFKWVIIAVLLVTIASMFFYPEATRKILTTIFGYSKPVTGYATGVVDKLVHNITNLTK